jgi:hypothetical protein
MINIFKDIRRKLGKDFAHLIPVDMMEVWKRLEAGIGKRDEFYSIIQILGNHGFNTSLIIRKYNRFLTIMNRNRYELAQRYMRLMERKGTFLNLDKVIEAESRSINLARRYFKKEAEVWRLLCSVSWDESKEFSRSIMFDIFSIKRHLRHFAFLLRRLYRAADDSEAQLYARKLAVMVGLDNDTNELKFQEKLPALPTNRYLIKSKLKIN